MVTNTQKPWKQIFAATAQHVSHSHVLQHGQKKYGVRFNGYSTEITLINASLITLRKQTIQNIFIIWQTSVSNINLSELTSYMCWLVEQFYTLKLWSMTLKILHFEAGFWNKNLKKGVSVSIGNFSFCYHMGACMCWYPITSEWNYHHNIWNCDHIIMCYPEAIIHSRSTFAIWRRWPCKCLKVTLCSRNQH